MEINVKNSLLFVGVLAQVYPDLQLPRADGTFNILRRMLVKSSESRACFIIPQMWDMQNILQHVGKMVKVYFKIDIKSNNTYIYNNLVATKITRYNPKSKELERKNFSKGGYVTIDEIVDSDGYVYE